MDPYEDAARIVQKNGPDNPTEREAAMLDKIIDELLAKSKSYKPLVKECCA